MKSAAVVLAVAAVSAFMLSAAEEAASAAEILNADSYLRVHFGCRTPVFADTNGRIQIVTAGRKSEPMREVATPDLPAEWFQPAFDDSAWVRIHAPVEVTRVVESDHAATRVHRVSVRGKFLVGDPAKAGDLTLALEYVGGVAVFLNGREIARAHLPAGELSGDTLAEGYPEDPYVSPDGKTYLQDPQTDPERFGKRYRTLEKVRLPQALLAAGVNVLAVDVHRAPLSEAQLKAKRVRVGGMGRLPGLWGTAALRRLTLTAPADSTARPNTSRPEGIQVWTPQPVEELLQWRYGDPCEKPSLALAGARNGTFNACLAISSTGPIRNAKVEAGALASKDGGSISAGEVTVRYAEANSSERTFNANPGFDGLLSAPPAEVPVSSASPNRLRDQRKLAADPVPGATLPVWISVHVPLDAKPGEYRGHVTVQADGLKPVAVPVVLNVADWTLPGPEDFDTRNNLYQSHESTALYYGVEPWSDKHFEMMGRVLALSKPAANRLCMLHLIRGAYHLNNLESMVRWIRKGDGYAHDFSIFDRYLDLYAEKLGKPDVLLLSVFQPHADKISKATNKQNGATVSLLDPAGGTCQALAVPEYGSPEGAAFWKAVLDPVRARLERRGWLDVAVIGTGSDAMPLPPTISMFKQAWPEARWMSSSHMNPSQYADAEKGKVPVVCREHVWAAGRLYDPDAPGAAGSYPAPWAQDAGSLEWAFPRAGNGLISALYETTHPAGWRMIAEASLQGRLTGIGRVGLDFFPVPKGDKGAREALSGPSSMHLGPSASTRMFLYPAAEGVVPTWRHLLFCESVQDREALVFLQKALAAGLAGERAGRIKTLLDDRARYYLATRPDDEMLWNAFAASGWQERERQLYALCVEVAKTK